MHLDAPNRSREPQVYSSSFAVQFIGVLDTKTTWRSIRWCQTRYRCHCPAPRY